MNRNKIISTLLTCSTLSNNVSALENIISLNSNNTIPNAGSFRTTTLLNSTILMITSILCLLIEKTKKK